MSPVSVGCSLFRVGGLHSLCGVYIKPVIPAKIKQWYRSLVKNAYRKTNFLISFDHPKHMSKPMGK